MAAYRKFSEAWWPTPENHDQGRPLPEAPKVPPEEDRTLDALGALGGAPVDFRKSEAAERRPGGLAASAGVASRSSGLLYTKLSEQNRNSLSFDQVAGRPGPAAEAAAAPPAENRNCSSPAAKAPKLPKAGALDERTATIEEAADAPTRWAEGYAALCTMPPPSRFSPERWRRIVDAAGMFLDRWGGEAIRCGWSDLDVFGCHDTAPTARFDCMGLVPLLDRCEVVAIDQKGADLVTVSGARRRFYRRALPYGTVSLWELRQ